ncbi:PTS sugar transporter subunit IIB [Pediococcus pentosaceus]|jgi:fructoselysine and glucoselysine-specific PTS system IIB component|uniref:PTS sugar transporter subunit IIB n=2 Tax=Pediococcus pentosaceus TaxID=1255 RepID=A0ABD7X845_PEDPE|nr:PTS sugar transporter subunit IIB [Pediococcus pentosaceus]AXR42853.1 PTS mannose/fructose/sorbose transporter subunit IIB [Pediococcus pentosaceus]KAF0517665.1 PTS mannose/fructose/sorbose transporter subunit IIB [Pediococcus pentosaceus]MBF7112194.1 PTS sugar transporter subunit IIB [Pediococcus pentosaceus]MBF7117449.1 PTS sugar transporter subunit IIB [Pediococcus pentosaceus]MBF7119191.1 PTS sugar transporter subunit IIB [Pediococcus pentosaceus]
MIVLTRVDHRLLHGQVAFSWTAHLSADCILIANDDVANDETKKTIVKLAKPSGIKLVIKSVEDSIKAINSGITDKYKLFIVAQNIDDAYKLISNVSEIQSLNLGGTKFEEGKESISSAIFVTTREKEELNRLIQNGVDVYTQQVPTSKRKKL